jgi:hypothetical protein
VNTVMNLAVTQNAENVLTSRETVTFSRSLLHAVSLQCTVSVCSCPKPPARLQCSSSTDTLSLATSRLTYAHKPLLPSVHQRCSLATLKSVIWLLFSPSFSFLYRKHIRSCGIWTPPRFVAERATEMHEDVSRAHYLLRTLARYTSCF